MSEPEMITRGDGTRMWFCDDRLHRKDGPAVEYANGDRYWFINDQMHRLDGPAIEYSSGYEEWRINGQQVDPGTLPLLMFVNGVSPND